MLELKNVSNIEKSGICKDISFLLESGFLLGIVGKNGAGKTTLLKTILGDRKSEGEIVWEGKKTKTYEFQQEITYIGEDAPFLKNEWAQTNAQIFQTLYPEFDEEIFFEEMERRKVPCRTHLNNLSRGQFLGFQLAFARAHKAQLYLLDEVTAGMDVVFRKDFYQFLRERLEENATILMTTHLQADIDQVADYVAVMERGKITKFYENV